MTRISGPTRAQLDQAADQYADLLDRQLARAVDLTMLTLGDRFDADDLGIIPQHWAALVDDRLAPTLALALHAGSADIRRQLRRHLGLTAAAWNGVPVTSQQLADAYLATATNRLVGVGDLTWQLAREQLLEGVRAGESIEQLKDRVAATTGLAGPRARNIAHNEVLDALNYGAFAEMAATGLDGTKEWADAGDQRVRETHRHADGQKVGVREKFTIGGWPADRPHDPALPAGESIGCRCGLLFHVALDDVSVEPAQPAVEEAQAQADHQTLGAVWVADAIRKGVTADDLAALLSLAPFLPDEDQSAAETAAAVTIPVAGSQEGAPVPWSVRNDHPDCSGYGVQNDDTGKLVPGGCHQSKAKAAAMVRALYANSGDEAKAVGDLEHFGKVDNTAWDGNAAMSSCGDAACYRAICAGRKAGPPDQRGSWALPHHKSAGGPPNAAGVRAALARFSATEGLQNAGVARAHLEAHMATIRNQSEEASVSATTTEELAHESADDTSQATEALEVEAAETLGGDPNPGTDKDKRLAENKDKRKKRASKRDAMAADPDESADDGAWEGILVIEGIPTGDGREFAPDSLVFADFPLPLTYQPPTHGGEPGPAIDVGVIDEAWRDDTEPRILRGRGRFDMKDPVAADYHRKVDEKFLRGMSIDMDDRDPITDVELAWSDTLIAWAAERGIDEDMVPMMLPPSKTIFLKGRVRGAALLSMPAFVEAQMWTAGAEPPPMPDLQVIEEQARAEEQQRELERNKEREAVTAAAVAHLDGFRPPVEWFQNPQLGQQCPITITDEGRVYGHAFRWDECHIGYADKCTSPPEEEDFPYYTQGTVVCADGSHVAVGAITLGMGHAPKSGRGSSPREAAEHYDNTDAVVADVAIGPDRVGAWVAGWIRPGTDPKRVYALRASGQVSGDWRFIGGRLRLVALLAVNVPGFPVPRPEARVAGGQVIALTAAGMLDVGPKVDWEAEIEQRALRSMRDRALAAFGDD